MSTPGFAPTPAELPVDLDAYCARIGYRGPRTPTIETLRALHERHPAWRPVIEAAAACSAGA